MVSSRKRTTLKLIAEAGGSLNRIDLVKLAFLLVHEARQLPPVAMYDFVPYRRGPFSFTLYHDLGILEAVGLVAPSGEHGVKITAHGLVLANGASEDIVEAVRETIRCHAHRGTDALIDYVYAEFPFFTMNSEWEHRRAVQRPTVDPQVFTVGYEGLSLEALLTILLKGGIRGLIDVRANPVARRYGFHRSTLSRTCSPIGIDYIHRPELGIESAWRSDLGSQADYDRLFTRYEEETLPDRKTEIAEVSALMLEMPSALMCLEADPCSCHRTRLAQRVSEITAMPVRDLREAQDALL